jgi:hypothetical protein
MTSTSRTVEGEQVTVGGVTVRIELDEGELSIRVSACDPLDGLEDERVAVSPDRKYGHGTLYTEGELPGEVHGHRFAVYQKRG